MSIPRGKLLIVVPIALLLAAAGGGLWVHQFVLPDPAHATREQLVRWLVTRDLGQEPPETCVALAKRLEEELTAGVDLGDWDGHLDEPYRQRALANAPYLLRAFLEAKADAYHRLPVSQRLGFLDSLLATLGKWREFEAKLPPEEWSSGPSAMDLLRREYQSIQTTAGPDQAQRVREFFTALQARWLTNRLLSHLRGDATP